MPVGLRRSRKNVGDVLIGQLHAVPLLVILLDHGVHIDVCEELRIGRLRRPPHRKRRIRARRPPAVHAEGILEDLLFLHGRDTAPVVLAHRVVVNVRRGLVRERQNEDLVGVPLIDLLHVDGGVRGTRAKVFRAEQIRPPRRKALRARDHKSGIAVGIDIEILFHALRGIGFNAAADLRFHFLAVGNDVLRGRGHPERLGIGVHPGAERFERGGAAALIGMRETHGGDARLTDRLGVRLSVVEHHIRIELYERFHVQLAAGVKIAGDVHDLRAVLSEHRVFHAVFQIRRNAHELADVTAHEHGVDRSGGQRPEDHDAVDLVGHFGLLALEVHHDMRVGRRRLLRRGLSRSGLFGRGLGHGRFFTCLGRSGLCAAGRERQHH